MSFDLYFHSEYNYHNMRHFIALFQSNLLLCLALAGLVSTQLRAQFNQSTLHLLSPEYEVEASRLLLRHPSSTTFPKPC